MDTVLKLRTFAVRQLYIISPHSCSYASCITECLENRGGETIWELPLQEHETRFNIVSTAITDQASGDDAEWSMGKLPNIRSLPMAHWTDELVDSDKAVLWAD